MSKHFSPYEAIYPKTAMDLVWLTAGDKLDNLIPPSANEACDTELTNQFKEKNISPFWNPEPKRSACRVASYWKSLAAVYPTPEHSPDDIPSLSMLVDIEETWTKVKKAHEMIVALKSLPHNDFYFGGMEHEYDPETWNNKVLPLIGNVSDYKNTILDAANSLHALAIKYDNPTLSGGMCYKGGEICTGPLYGIIDLSSFPTLVRPVIEALTFMTGEIVNFQGGDGGARIECEGDECPDEDASDDFRTVYTSSVCYMNGPLADEAICYDSTFNPHLGGAGFMFVGMWLYDSRTGDTEFTNFYYSPDGPEGPNKTSLYGSTASSKIIVE